MITPQMRNTLKGALNRFLNQSASISVDEITIDEIGGQVSTSMSVATGVRCRVMRPTAADMRKLVGMQEVITEIYKIAFEQGTALGTNQRVTVDGVTYNIVSIVTHRTDDLDEQAIVVRQS